MKLKTASPEAVFIFYVTNITKKLKIITIFSFFFYEIMICVFVI